MQWETPPLENGQVTGRDKDQVAVFLVFVFFFFLTTETNPLVFGVRILATW